MKKITINYLSHTRPEYSELNFYFLKKIKPENKKLLKLNILYTETYDWSMVCDDLDIDYIISKFEGSHNYLSKIQNSLSQETKYSCKLDEDCFINNNIWDYIIENIDVLDNEENLLISPTLSNNIPGCDYFIEGFVTNQDIKEKIFNEFLKQEMPNGLWNTDYSPLNSHTVNSIKWDAEEFYSGVKKLNTIFKGIHPIRISYNSQIMLNDYILNNFNELLRINDYEFIDLKRPYFTNSFFFIKTETWRSILNSNLYDSYDEVPLNLYRERENKKMLFIKNGFGVHLMYNTVYNNNNRWNIGGENGELVEKMFYKNLLNKIKYDSDIS